MPVTNTKSKWVSGRLVFTDKDDNDILIMQEPLSMGSGFVSASGAYASSTCKQGSIFKTEIICDITGSVSTSGDTQIIGNSGVSHIGENLTLLSGTLLGGQVTCLETPAGGTADIDLYSATVGTGEVGDQITDLTETALLTKGGNWSASATPVRLSALPTDTEYLYLTNGAAAAEATYTAGRFLIELWGV